MKKPDVYLWLYSEYARKESIHRTSNYWLETLLRTLYRDWNRR